MFLIRTHLTTRLFSVWLSNGRINMIGWLPFEYLTHGSGFTTIAQKCTIAPVTGFLCLIFKWQCVQTNFYILNMGQVEYLDPYGII